MWTRVYLLPLVFLSTLAFAAPDTTPPGTVTASEAQEAVSANQALLVDVRSAEEFNSAHIAGATNIQHDQVEANLSKFGTDKNRQIILYCKSGRRAGLAREALIKNGYTNVWNAGGYEQLAADWNSRAKAHSNNSSNY